MRRATVVAAIRRGWVWPIMRGFWPAGVWQAPRPSASAILGNWVVLPEPVSPQTITTGCWAMAAMMSSRRKETGSSGGNSIFNGRDQAGRGSG